jgi:hypothetical protein
MVELFCYKQERYSILGGGGVNLITCVNLITSHITCMKLVINSIFRLFVCV